MTAEARRNVKEIDPVAREIAQTLARQSGLSLADWIASLMGAENGPAANFKAQADRDEGGDSPGRLEAPPHPADTAGELVSAVKSLTDRLAAIETRSTAATPAVDETVRTAISRLVEAGREQVAVAARFEGAVAEIGGEQARMADRLRRVEAEGSGRRSTEALRALEGTLGKMAGHLYEGESRTREAIEEITAKLRRVEAEQSPPPAKLADTIVGLANRLEEAEARTKEALGELGESLRALDARLGDVEVAGLAAASSERLEQAESRTSATMRNFGDSLAALDARLDGVQEIVQASASAERLAEIEARAAQTLGAIEARMGDLEAQVSTGPSSDRLEQMEARASDALGALGQSVGDLDERLGAAEQTLAGAATASALDEVTRDLLDRVDVSQSQLGERLAAEADSRLDHMARSLAELGDELHAVEERSQGAIGQMGREVIDLSQSLARRVQAAEHSTSEAIEQMGGEVSRLAHSVDEKLGRADSVQAHALERLGDEIARISERLAERIATADRNSAHAIEEVGDQMARVTERLSQRHERTNEDLAERIRVSEERTTRVLEETRDEIERMSLARRRATDFGGGATAGDGEQEPLFGDDPFTAFTPPPAAPEALGARPVFSQEDLDLADSFPASSAAGAEEAAPPAPAARAQIEPIDFERLMGAGFDTPSASPTAPGPTVTTAEPARSVEEAPGVFPPPTASASATLIEKGRAAALAASAGPRTSRRAQAPLFGGGASASGTVFPQRRFADSRRRSSGGPAALGLGLAAALGLALGGFWFMQNEPHGSISSEMARLLPGASPSRDATAPAGAGGSAGLPQMAVALAPGRAGPGAHDLTTPTEDMPSVYAGAVTRLAANDAHGLDDLRRIAGLGYAPAQFYLAKLYETGGYGVGKDPVLARTWTQRAAQGGDARAMHNLALDDYEGTGGPRSIPDAARWFARAAALGVADSQYNLGLLYEEGHGVPKNPAEAYKWYLIAARSGDADSRSNAERLKALLTPEARSAAERSAAAFRPAQPSIAGSSVAATTAPSAVARAQKALAGLGYYQGPSDGTTSPALQMALSAYQRDQGLPVTGTPDTATVTKLELSSR